MQKERFNLVDRRRESEKLVRRESQGQLQKLGAARLSLFSNVVLTVLKVLVGVATGSVSILAEAAHSMSDLLASGLTFFSVRTSELPPDESHPYGHGKVESLSAMAEAFLLMAAALYIMSEAVIKLLGHERPERLDWGIGVMAVAAFVNIFVVRHMIDVARKTGSQALKADAENHRADIYAAGGVFVGLVLVKVTGIGLFDPIMAFAVALLIVKAAWDLATGAFSPLMDAQLSGEDVAAVREILESESSVLAYHKLRTRQSGAARFVDAHVMMDDDLTLAEAHDLTEKVEELVRKALPNTEVTLHTEPYYAELKHQEEVHSDDPAHAPVNFKKPT